MGPTDIETMYNDYNWSKGGDGKVHTIGRNGAKREVTEREILEKYLERKAANGEFIETMKVTYARRRGAAARRSVGKPPRETDAPRHPPRVAHARLGPL